MTYQPFLPEAAAGSVEPRHVVVPLRRVLNKCEILTGRFVSLDHERRVARIQPTRGEAFDLSYEVVVLAPGSIARTLPIPGPGRAGHRLQAGRGGHRAAQPGARQARHRDERHRPRGPPQAAHLRVRRRRLRRHRGAGRARGHGLLRDPLLPGPVQGRHPVRARRGDRPDPARGRRGPRAVHRPRADASARSTYGSTPGSSRASTATSCSPTARSSTPRPSSGRPASRPTRSSRKTGLPLDDKGRLRCRPDLRVEGVDGAWSAGDCASVPDLTGRPGRDDEPERAARRAAGQGPRRQHRPGAQRPQPAAPTRTSTSARSPRSACTRASPRSTASSCAASRPGSCTGPTT